MLEPTSGESRISQAGKGDQSMSLGFITARNSSCGKLMFSETSVSHSVHGGLRGAGVGYMG